jgi:hypothetical protein
MSLIPFAGGEFFGPSANTGVNRDRYNTTVRMNDDCIEQVGALCGEIEYSTRATAKGPITFQANDCNFGFVIIGDIRGDDPKGGMNGASCYIFEERLPITGGVYPVSDFALVEQNDGSFHYSWIYEKFWVTAEGTLDLEM